MEDKKPSRRELERRKKIRKFWADHPEAKKAQSEKSTQIWDDQQRRKAKSEEMTQFYRNHPERREAQSKRQKRAMRDPKRLKINSTTMKRLKADPEFETRRLAGIRKAEAAPERKARRRATLARTLAVRAVSNRRTKATRKATRTEQYRSGMRANKNKFWADLRARLAKIPNRPGRRPKQDDIYRSAARLVGIETWREIARKFDPKFADNPKAARNRMRVGVERFLERQKPEDSRR